jgi:hypothetical protein
MNRNRVLRSVLVGGLAAAALGCSGSPTAPSSQQEEGKTPADSDNPGNGSTTDAGPAVEMPKLSILPTETHSGFDGTHTFRVPVAVYGSKDATLTASDPSAVDIQPIKLVDASQDDGVYFLVTSKKVGDITLTSKVGGATATSKLTIAAYTTAQWDVGSQRYTNAASSGPACVSCHAASGGIDHSPSRMASATDSDVVSVITTGILVAGNPITQVKHKWGVSDAEATGLVTYLRALAPRGFVGLQ